jgi:hypothetical protein
VPDQTHLFERRGFVLSFRMGVEHWFFITGALPGEPSRSV